MVLRLGRQGAVALFGSSALAPFVIASMHTQDSLTGIHVVFSALTVSSLALSIVVIDRVTYCSL